LELQFHKAVLLKCNASFFHIFASYRPGRGLPEAIRGNHFPAPTTSISNGDEIGLQHEGRSADHAINNGVGAMTFILRFIYREYCRSCFLHIRYL